MKPIVTELNDDSLKEEVRSNGGLLICTAGYEDRALNAATLIGRPKDSLVRVVRLVDGDAANDIARNQKNFLERLTRAKS